MTLTALWQVGVFTSRNILYINSTYITTQISFSEAGKRTLGVKKMLAVLTLMWSLHDITPPVIPNSRVNLPSSELPYCQVQFYIGRGRHIFIPMLVHFFQKSLLQSNRRYSPKRIGKSMTRSMRALRGDSGMYSLHIHIHIHYLMV